MKRPIEISVEQLVTFSGFAAEARRRFPEQADPTQAPRRPDGETCRSEPLKALRRYRQLGSVHILWRDLIGEADIVETGQAISSLARSCLEMALTAAEARVAVDHGELLDEAGQPIRLVVLGLGKFGGDELNFNSDIDLVFAWSGRKATSTGPRRLEAAEWLKRVARELINLIDTVTEDGRVWIVDTRLRPFGDSGALVWSVSAMEQYFLNEGRTWERYAWLKAAPVAGDIETGQRLIDALQPFIYRRYLDYGIFDSLRELHQKIDANSRARSHRDDIKRGAGGIRELEFMVQSQQILRGGHEPGLRQPGFLPALAAAVGLGLIEPDDGEDLTEAYAYLRILENRLQATTGRQGHHLPEDEDTRTRLATLMGFTDWKSLMAETNHHRERVRQHFAERFREPEINGTAIARLWPPEDGLEKRLEQAGFEQAEPIRELLETLHRRTAHRALSAEGRRRLEKLMPLLLSEAGRHQRPALGLDDLLELIEQISRRSAYLALLYERPATLERLIRVFRSSARLAEWIIASPQLLDDLLDPIHGFDLPGIPEQDIDDPESSLHALGRWRQAGYLRTALAELDQRLDAQAASARLTGVAETIIGRVLGLISENEPDLAVIGYGNLGAGLLHYESDLDLVFLHGNGPAPVRTAQRLISFMQMPLPGGRLFEIDTRLRPNGRSGLLVSRLDSFTDYQRTQAWTWEHQALIRARWIGGNPDLANAFEHARGEVLSQRRDPDQLRQDLLEMRQRQKRERKEDGVKALLTDIQYITEFGVLAQATDQPELIEHRQPDQQLQLLADSGWLPASTAQALGKAWQALSSQRHHNWLAREPQDDIDPELTETIAAAWQSRFGPADRG
jgi:[glutamine synthetase] adenylyltransferase / [glutamine synthetase]-adenylyl-L-tyrosine phosphorylase